MLNVWMWLICISLLFCGSKFISDDCCWQQVLALLKCQLYFVIDGMRHVSICELSTFVYRHWDRLHCSWGFTGKQFLESCLNLFKRNTRASRGHLRPDLRLIYLPSVDGILTWNNRLICWFQHCFRDSRTGNMPHSRHCGKFWTSASALTFRAYHIFFCCCHISDPCVAFFDWKSNPVSCFNMIY